MVFEGVSIKETWMNGKEQDIFGMDARRRASTVEVMKPMGTLGGQSMGEMIGDGGVLADYGCGKGELGALLARRHNKVLLQADVLDMREPSIKANAPLVNVDRHSPPDFSKTDWALLGKSIDRILLTDVLDKVIYKDLDPIQSKLELLKRLSSLLTTDGKIMVVNESAAARQSVDSGMVGKLQEIIEADDQLKGKVIFF